MQNPLARIATVVGAVALTAAPLAWSEEEEDEIPFSVAELFFELNNTDGDLGIHSLIDGDGWKRLIIEDPAERKMLNVRVKGRLRRQGLTEFFFESAEPNFEDLDPAVFFRRFPEGDYEIEGRTLEGDEMESETAVTHLLPAPPEPSINGIPFTQDCDEGPVPEFEDDDLIISWAPVTRSHPDLGRTDEPITVVNYEVVVELEDTPYKISAILPTSVTSFEVPEEILELGEEFKYEVLVREASFNQTATESCFALEEDD